MNTKERKSLSNIIAGFYLISTLAIYWFGLKSTNIYILFAILITVPIIERLVFIALPKKNTSKSHSKNKQKLSSAKQRNMLRSDNVIIKSKLEDLSWREFERLCYLYFKSKGFKASETTEGADGGVDLVVYNKHHKANEAIQIKHYIASGNRITVKEIRELNSAKRNHNCPLAMFITTSSFTKDALLQADKWQIECKDIHWVNSNIVKWQEQQMKTKTYS
ncbi:restriction system protein [Metabacillus crassostreae]|uniref:restriction endonuclease n=1 Tax=Metabacillus crassostreae TaxID=929098 RepID=UPI00195E3DD3|nr:restriction endonuclease [Metabacillus crassostreae]MBM7605582.1 restriction system protein [Metabacillus crassostreae]